MAEKKKQTEKAEEKAVTEEFTLDLGDREVTVAVEQPQAEVAYYYLSDRNPNNAFIPGVPLSDLTQEVVDAQPKWVQKSIKGSPMYKAANASDDENEDKGDKE